MKTAAFDRRTLIQAVALSTLSAQAAALAASQRLNLQHRTPQDDLLLWAKLKADLSGRTLYSITTGTVWGFKPQADDLSLDDFAKRLYGYTTCIARRGSMTADGQITFKSKSWNFYLDADTRQFTRDLLNPYTGQRVTAAPMLSATREQLYSVDGLLETPAIPLEIRKPPRPFDLQVQVVGEQAFVNETNFIRFKPNDISWHKLEGTLWSHACKLRDLTDRSLTHIPSTWSQNLVAEWQTWMNMHDTPGHILFKGEGCHVAKLEQLPEAIRRNIEAVNPGGLAQTTRW